MINDDILIKFARNRGHREDWPEQVNIMKNRLLEMRLGFPGIRNEHLSLVQFKAIQRDDIFIYDLYTESQIRGDEAPLMLKSLGSDQYYVEGIGCGVDSKRDPDRLKIRWKDTIYIPDIPEESLVEKVDIRPTLNGGPGYYYFFKAYRDNRL